MRGACVGLAVCAARLAWSAGASAEPPAPVVITHAKIYLPGNRAPLDDGTIVLSAGSIVSVGATMAAPAGARTIDARGNVVTPGLIDADCYAGMVDVEQEPEANDADVRQAVTPALRMADGYNPRSILLPVARTGGVTSIVVTPHNGLLGGRSAFANLAGDSVSEALVRPVLAQYAHLDEEAGEPGQTRSGMWLVIREALEDARFYSTHRAQYDANGVRPLHLHREELEALVPVIRGEQPLVLEAHRASDIEAALQLSDEFRLRLVLSGASEAWMVAAVIARHKVPVIVDPMEDLPERFDRLHSRADNAALLAREGVSVIIATFSAYGVRLLWQHAGNAVRFGMDHDAAIRAITEAPADAFGLRGYGRLEPGAVGNVVVWSGDPLQASTRVEHVFVRGQEQPLETRQTLLLRRYRTLPVRRAGAP